jgi:hypothetical protein
LAQSQERSVHSRLTQPSREARDSPYFSMDGDAENRDSHECYCIVSQRQRLQERQVIQTSVMASSRHAYLSQGYCPLGTRPTSLTGQITFGYDTSHFSP